MSEPIKPRTPALAEAERTKVREKLWDRYMSLAQKFATDLRTLLQNDPWDEGVDFSEEEVQGWADAAQKASAELDSLFSDTEEFLTARCPEDYRKMALDRIAARKAKREADAAKPADPMARLNRPPF